MNYKLLWLENVWYTFENMWSYTHRINVRYTKECQLTFSELKVVNKTESMRRYIIKVDTERCMYL